MMTDDALNINVNLVQQLVSSQFPDWSNLKITEVHPNGWDNRTFRLGDRMSVRLPSAARYSLQVDKEQKWLPVLSEKLPLPVPKPLARGEPNHNYPYNWSIYEWIDGHTATPECIDDMAKFATELGGFLIALRRINAEGGPGPGPGHRGGDLNVYNDQTQKAIEILSTKSNLDTQLLAEVWDTALSSKWVHPPVWIHGDISSGNVLVNNGEISAVIDFGSTAIGDPACDLSIAWTMFDKGSRDAFRTIMDLDDDTWARGKGWTLWKSLIILSGIEQTNTFEAKHSLETVYQLLNDEI